MQSDRQRKPNTWEPSVRPPPRTSSRHNPQSTRVGRSRGWCTCSADPGVRTGHPGCRRARSPGQEVLPGPLPGRASCLPRRPRRPLRPGWRMAGGRGRWGLWRSASCELPATGHLRDPAYIWDIGSPIGIGPPLPIIPFRRTAVRRRNAGCCTTTRVLSFMWRATIPRRAGTRGTLRLVPSLVPWTGHCRYRTRTRNHRLVSGAAPDTYGHPT